MSKQEKSRKPLIVGIIAAVVILAVLLVLLLTQCTGGQDATNSTPAQTTGGEEIPTYSLYWNLDRAEYDGKSEAGMSSRQPESDGYFHVRFFIDGETVELKVADRKTINAIDVNDIMDLVFDEDGIVVGMISLDDLPCEQVGWKFYVQSAAKTVIKLNSSSSFNGMEVLLDIEDNTGIYDMTGSEGEVGKTISPISGDHVIAIADLGGKLTHVFVFERPTYMETFKAECQHCKETVEWKMWNKTNALPLTAGHYQLQNDIQLKAQQSMGEDAVICLDLNGCAVDGGENCRMYSLHNVGCELAIMDTSEEQTGTLRAHGEYSGQGGVVWTRYGACYLYSGTLDASDMTTLHYGAAVNVPKNTYFYMYGGTIIGGTGKYRYDESTGKYSYGNCGGVYIQGKFVMRDGVIRDGYAQGAITARNADGTAKSFYGGRGGNVMVGSGGEFEMYGGTIKNGKATTGGGNLCVENKGYALLEGGVISGGRAIEYKRNGGNVYLNGSKSAVTMNGGYIINGKSYNCAGNLYLQGTFTMNGGYIGGGQCLDYATNKVNATVSSSNVFNVNGTFVMYGGTIDGGFSCIDTAKDTTQCSVTLGGLAKISSDGKQQFDDLTLSVGGDNIKVVVAKLADGAKIGVNTSMGIFTTPTSEANLDNFYSNVEGSDVCYYNGCLGLGRVQCVCGLDANGKHIGDCDGTTLFWGPVKGNTLSNAGGNFYLTADMKLKNQCGLLENAVMHLDLNGYTLEAPDNLRAISVHNTGAFLTITDSSAAKTGTIRSTGEGMTQGNCIWLRYGSAVIYQGIIDGRDYKLYQKWDKAGKDGVWGTSDDTVSVRDGSAVCLTGGTSLTMYGGTIIGGETVRYTHTKTVTETEGEGEDAVTTSYEATFTSASGNGGAMYIPGNAVFNMYGGVIRDGKSQNSAGNVYLQGTLNMYGGTIENGFAGLYKDEETGTFTVKGWGGNMDVQKNGTLNMLGDAALITGGTSGGNGGNIRFSGGSTMLNMEAGTITKGESLTDQGGNMFIGGMAELTGGTVSDGTAKNGGNIIINSTKEVKLAGVTVSGGTATNGGNIRIATTALTGKLIIEDGTLITGGTATNGGNLAVESNNANKNGPIALCEITGGTIEKGIAKNCGGNIFVGSSNSAETGSATLTISGGTVTAGKAATETAEGKGGNIYLGHTCSTLNISGTALIENGVAGDYANKTIKGFAGNINLNAGTVNMSGGTVSGGQAPNNGGSIRLAGAGCVFNLTGGTITGGQTRDNGGNFWIGKGGELNVVGTYADGKYSVEIKDGTANASGGNIHANGGATVMLEGAHIHDGSINGNKAHNMANIRLWNSGTVATIGNVKVDGRFYISKETTVSIVGKPEIKAEGVSNLTLESGVVLEISDLVMGEDSAMVGISGDGKFAAPATSAQLAYFFSDANINMFYDEAALWIGTAPLKYCLCGESSTDPDATHAHGDTSATNGCDGTILKWQPWSSTSTLPTTTGNYYLTETVSFKDPSTILEEGAVINLDLNGQTVQNLNYGTDDAKNTRLYRFWNTKSGEASATGNNVTLRFIDTSEEGSGVIRSDSHYSQGCIAWVNGTNNTIIMLSGTIDASKITCSGNVYGAGAIDLAGTNGSFVMYGGTFIGGNTPYGGDAVHGNTTSSIAIHGGTIKASETSPTGVVIRAFGTATIDGGTVNGIVEMNAKNGYGNLTLSGSPAIEEIYLSHTKDDTLAFADTPVLPVITITGELGNTTPIAVSTMGSAAGTFTGTTVEANADNFVSSTAHLVVAWDADTQTLKLVEDLNYCLCGDHDGHEDTSAANGCNGTVLTWTAWTSTNSLPTIAGNYYLTADVALSGTQTAKEADIEINIDLNGHTVYNSSRTLAGKTFGYRLYRIDPEALNTIVRITDLSRSGSGVIRCDAIYDQGSIFWVRAQGAQVVLLNGTIDGSGMEAGKNDDGSLRNAYGANAICLAAAQSKFVMYGGTFIGGNTPYGGDAVAGDNWDSQIEIYGGTMQASENSPTNILIRSKGDTLISGGVVAGTVEANNKDKSATLTLSGAPTVEGIYLSCTAGNTLTPADEPVLPVINITDELGSTAAIKVSTMSNANSVITAETVEANFSKFAPASSRAKLVWNAETNKIEYVALGTEHTEHDETWHKLTATTTALTEGRWYLEADSTAKVTSTEGVVIVCLNGHSWTGDLPLTVTGGEVIFCDCSAEKTGSVTAVSVAADAALSVEAGSVGSVNAADGAAVSVVGGAVTTLTAEAVTVSGGTVTTLTADSATISGGTLGTVNVAAATLSGAPTVTSLSASENSLTINDLSSSASIGITADGAAVLSAAAPYSSKAAFSSVSADYQIAVTENGLELMSKDVHVHCVCGGTVADGTEFDDGTVHNCVDVIYVSGLTNAKLTENKNYYLTETTNIPSQLWTQGYTLNLCLNGHNITNNGTGNRVFAVNSASTFNITSCQADVIDKTTGYATNNSIATTGSGVQDGSCIWTSGTGSNANIYGVTLNASGLTLNKNGTSNKHGAGVKIAGSTTVTMYSGTVIGGSTGAGCNGGAMSVDGTLVMHGGKIVGGNTANEGGTLHLGGTLRMYDGWIGGGMRNNSYKYRTATIATNTNTRIYISGGEICGGVAAMVGGAQIHISGSAKLTGLSNVTGDKNDDYYRVMLQSDKMITLVIGERDSDSKISVSNVMVSGASLAGKFATAAEGYTLTQADADSIGVWYNGGANKTMNDVALVDGELHFVWVDAE